MEHFLYNFATLLACLLAAMIATLIVLATCIGLYNRVFDRLFRTVESHVAREQAAHLKRFNDEMIHHFEEAEASLRRGREAQPAHPVARAPRREPAPLS